MELTYLTKLKNQTKNLLETKKGNKSQENLIEVSETTLSEDDLIFDYFSDGAESSKSKSSRKNLENSSKQKEPEEKHQNEEKTNNLPKEVPKDLYEEQTAQNVTKSENFKEEKGQGDGKFVKPPIPKPRTKFRKKLSEEDDSISKFSQATYDLPKKTLQQDESPVKSDRTFDLNSPKFLEKHNFETSEKLKVESPKNSTEEPIECSIDSDSKIGDNSQVKIKKPKKKFRTKKIAQEDYVLEIKILKTDRLKLDPLLLHPVVKIHIVDTRNGKYSNGILPTITKPYYLYQNRTLTAFWNESIEIAENFQYFTENSKNIIYFFEILDSVSISTVNKHENDGWHKIAWAFYKPAETSLDALPKNLRLQLYYPKKSKNKEVFSWWTSGKFTKYPSTLHISLNKTASRETLQVISEIKEVQEEIPKKNEAELDFPKFSNYCFKNGKLPNCCNAKLETYNDGCLVAKFSTQGTFLAYGVKIEEIYTVLVISITTFELVKEFCGHDGLIYSINWSENDQFLVTASADSTVCIWDFQNGNLHDIIKHGSYVYSSVINSNNIIASGGYEKLIKMYDLNNKLITNLIGHKGYITSLCFTKNSKKLYSSDSCGVIIEWSLNHHSDYTLKREIKLLDLRDTDINQILLYPNEKRLLIHAKDSVLRILDLKTACVLYWLRGAINNKIQTTTTFSSCGTFILCGTENGCIFVWNSELGTKVAFYKPYCSFRALRWEKITVNCVEFHPFCNLLVVGHFGSNLPILVISTDEDDRKGATDVGLSYFEQPKRKIDNIERILSKKGVKRSYSVTFDDIIKKMDQIVVPFDGNSD